MENIKKCLNISNIMNIILILIYSLLIFSSIFIILFYDEFITRISSYISDDFKIILASDYYFVKSLLIILFYISTIPFLIGYLYLFFKIKGLFKIDENINRHKVIGLSMICMLSLAFPIAYYIINIICYVILRVGNIYVVLIPFVATLPLYIISIYNSFKSLKLLDIKYKHQKP